MVETREGGEGLPTAHPSTFYTTLHHSTLHSTPLYSTVQRSTLPSTLLCIALHHSTLCYTTPHHATLHIHDSTPLLRTVHYCTPLYTTQLYTTPHRSTTRHHSTPLYVTLYANVHPSTPLYIALYTTLNLRTYDGFIGLLGSTLEREGVVCYGVAWRGVVVWSHFCHSSSQDLTSILALYEGAWNELSEKWYKNSSWPKVEVIAPFVNNDALFLVLYKEMYYRHVYSLNSGTLVTLEDRVESFQNYFNLFAYLIKTPPENIDISLPNQWIWDMIDEFIWQYNDYAKFRAKLANMRFQATKDPEVEKNIEFVAKQKDIWSSVYVIVTLNALVTKSDIKHLLDTEKRDGPSSAPSSSGAFFIKMLGYYSLIGLLRVHTLLGDYHTAIKCIDSIDFTKRVQLFSKVVACHITLFYYTGFVFMMLRRYADAVKFFTQLLTYINRIKNIHTRSYQYDDIIKKNEQVYPAFGSGGGLSSPVA